MAIIYPSCSLNLLELGLYWSPNPRVGTQSLKEIEMLENQKRGAIAPLSLIPLPNGIRLYLFSDA